MQKGKIVLIGPPGAGKSTVGKALSKELKWDLADSDRIVEERTGRKISDIFVEDGESTFRKIEEEVVLELLKDFEGVISLGGGAPINPKIESLLSGADYPVIFLDVTIAQAAVRIGFNKERPLLLVNPRQQWISLMSTRRAVYEKLATKTISTDSKKPADAAAEIVNLLGINA